MCSKSVRSSCSTSNSGNRRDIRVQNPIKSLYRWKVMKNKKNDCSLIKCGCFSFLTNVTFTMKHVRVDVG